jgi:mono/diheme cytochrome c family protein
MRLLILALAGGIAACSAKTPGAADETGAAQATGAAPTAGASAAGVSAAGSRVAGRRIYDANCVPCHQQNGMGIPGVYPSLAGSPVVLGDPTELTLWVIKGQRPRSMPAGRYPTQMLQFGWMKPTDAAALFTYMRANFGNSASPVDTAAVAKALGQ